MSGKRTKYFVLGWFLMGGLCSAQQTNFYHFDREFVPVAYTSGAPTTCKIIAGARSLSGIVGPTNISIIPDQTKATEFEAVSLGYDSPEAAWTSAVAIYPQCFQVHSNATYDNAGWIKVTHEAYGDWGAFLWYLQDTIAFTSSASSVYVSPNDATSAIASVLVGTIGDFCPQTVVLDVGPAFDTNYLGAGISTDYLARADLNAYYKLVPFSYLGVNNDDSDGDGIPDFADGYNLDGQAGNPDDISTNDFFTPWPVLLSGYADPTQALVSITYSNSDPAGVTAGTNGFTPASGYFRLWRTQAAHARNGASISSGGDYIPPGTYAATSLGFSVSTRLVDLFIEPVTPVTNQKLVVEVDPDGPGPKGFVCSDKLVTSLLAVKVTNIKFNWDTNSSASDAINLRQDYSNAYDISNGEWVKGVTNMPACYTTNKSVAIKVRLMVQPASITSADIWAVSINTNGSLGDIIKTNVTFSNGISVGDAAGYVTFQVAGTTPTCIQKTTNDIWQWMMENINATGSVAFDFSVSGPHTIYTILEEAISPWDNTAGSQKNAWTKALDFTIVSASCNGDSSASNALTHIAQYLHTGHGLTYDINGGSPAYASSHLGGTFQLTDYIDKSGGSNVFPPRTDNIVNCYDQAGGICSLGTLLGISVTYRFMNPFGYINTVNLVGEGNCNNPFYPVSTSGLKIAGADDVDPARKCFGNHAFTSLGGYVFDACAGPAIGTQTESQYVSDTVDTSTPAEAAGPPWFAPRVAGDPSNISSGAVTDIQ
ncbi:MAG: hypothetical protein KKC51_00260 [Verrucomicrobia bacterium]|nr:hypothetical protein [Verrucomicrobiota bacterium]